MSGITLGAHNKLDDDNKAVVQGRVESVHLRIRAIVFRWVFASL